MWENVTYYDILEIDVNAEQAEVTKAKNRLAKLYHPDTNMQNGIDTTDSMVQILEAYHTLSDPDSRAIYDEKVLGRIHRNFQTFTMEETQEDTKDFLQYWRASESLHHTVQESCEIIKEIKRHKAKRLPVFHRLIHRGDVHKEKQQFLSELAQLASLQVALLTSSGIPADLWNQEAMNWVLVRWSQKQDSDYIVLFHRYRVYRDEHEQATEQAKRRLQNRRFHHRLNKLLLYAT